MNNVIQFPHFDTAVDECLTCRHLHAVGLKGKTEDLSSETITADEPLDTAEQEPEPEPAKRGNCCRVTNRLLVVD